MTIATLLIALLVLALLLPYRWSRARVFGGVAGGWTSMLYTYAYGPGYERLEFVGLRQLQGWLLLVITTLAGRLQPDLLAWLVAAIRQVLGR